MKYFGYIIHLDALLKYYFKTEKFSTSANWAIMIACFLTGIRTMASGPFSSEDTPPRHFLRRDDYVENIHPKLLPRAWLSVNSATSSKQNRDTLDDDIVNSGDAIYGKCWRFMVYTC